MVCPAGFTSDHLEVLYDLDIEARRVAGEPVSRSPHRFVERRAAAVCSPGRARRTVGGDDLSPVARVDATVSRTTARICYAGHGTQIVSADRTTSSARAVHSRGSAFNEASGERDTGFAGDARRLDVEVVEDLEVVGRKPAGQTTTARTRPAASP